MDLLMNVAVAWLTLSVVTVALVSALLRGAAVYAQAEQSAKGSHAD